MTALYPRPEGRGFSACNSDNIPYTEVGEKMGYSPTYASTQVQNGASQAVSAVEEIIQQRQDIAESYAKRLKQLNHVHVVEVTNVETKPSETVYDLETESHTFTADGILTHNCHALPADTHARLATIDTDYRIGLSATPYREDERTDYIFALTGTPVGIEWEELMQYGNFEYPTVSVYLYGTPAQKRDDLEELVSESVGKTLVFCDSIEKGEELAAALDVPFVHGGTPTKDRLSLFREHSVVIGSRVADEGLSLDDLDRVIEYDFHGGSRRQELQRAGRLMHADGLGQHIVQMTDEEYEDYGRRLYSLEEKGMDIRVERRA